MFRIDFILIIQRCKRLILPPPNNLSKSFKSLKNIEKRD